MRFVVVVVVVVVVVIIIVVVVVVVESFVEIPNSMSGPGGVLRAVIEATATTHLIHYSPIFEFLFLLNKYFPN